MQSIETILWKELKEITYEENGCKFKKYWIDSLYPELEQVVVCDTQNRRQYSFPYKINGDKATVYYQNKRPYRTNVNGFKFSLEIDGYSLICYTNERYMFGEWDRVLFVELPKKYCIKEYIIKGDTRKWSKEKAIETAKKYIANEKE